MKHRRITLLLTLTIAILMALPMPALAAKRDWHALNGEDQVAVQFTLLAQPQYAGWYLEDGTLHVLSTRPTEFEETAKILGEYFDFDIVVDRKAAQYTYVQLANGYEKLSYAMKELDVWSVGLNEKANRLELVSEKTWSSARKREAAKIAGLPQEAIRFLKESNPFSPLDLQVDPPVNAPENNGMESQMAADRGLNVRSGPGTKYDIVGELEKGNVVTVLEKSGNWAKIRYADGRSVGYVYAAYLDPYKGSGSYETGTSFENTHYAAANVKVYSGPGTNHIRLGTLRKGELVKVVGRSGSWTEIQWYPGSAYVSSAHLRAK